MKPLTLIFFLVLMLSTMVQSQETKLFLPRNVKQSVMKGVRGEDGAPGKNYWQNSADYDIQVAIDPETRILTGKEKIKYFNNSPDSLNQLVLGIYMDILNKDSYRDFPMPKDLFNEGVSISSLIFNDQKLDLEKDIQRRGTNLFIKPEQGIGPNEISFIEISWSYQFLEELTFRTGHYGEQSFFAGYFYPKVAVYDDLDGWDEMDYTGICEFYSDFNNYNVEITMPSNFIVWATGTLENPKDILSKKYLDRYNEALSSNKVINIVTPADLKEGKITKKGDSHTWKFKAKNCPDFAFATSKNHLWDGLSVIVDPASSRRTFLDVAYKEDSKDFYGVAKIAKQALIDLSTDMPGVPYPYPCMTIYNANAGMEFPMLCNNPSTPKDLSTISLTYHEIFHTYFPFHVGVNERKYAWMDEGWASLFPEFFIKKNYPKLNYLNSRKERYLKSAGTEKEAAIIELTYRLKDYESYRQATYNKPCFAYLYLVDFLGEEQFKRIFKAYIERWAGKHPTPHDFFNTVEDLSGMNLSWFWKPWFFERSVPDLSIRMLKNNRLRIDNLGGLPLPIELNIYFKDGSHIQESIPLKVWSEGRPFFDYQIKDKKEIKNVKMGSATIPDIDISNNVLTF